jgi:hypothetical protein
MYQDGIMRTVGSFSELSDNLGFLRKQRSCGSSKADKLLGSGTGDTDPFSLEKKCALVLLLSTKLDEQELGYQNFLMQLCRTFFILLKHQSLHCDLYMFLLTPFFTIGKSLFLTIQL